MIIFTVFLTITLCTFCTAGNEDKKSVNQLIEASNQFTKYLFMDYAEKSNNPNLIISPLSAWITLSMAAAGASGRTFKEMKQSLLLPKNLKNLRYLTNEFKQFTEELKDVKDIDLHIKNKLFVSKNFKMKKQFENIIKNVFNSKVSTFDSSDPENSANDINSWVREATNEKIDNLINQDEITEDLRMILLNAVYFKGEWKTKFDPAETSIESFYYSENKVMNVTTMKVKSDFLSGSLKNLGAKFIQLPYKNGAANMTIIVPNKNTKLNNLIQNFNFFSSSRIEKVGFVDEIVLSLPKFKIESEIDMVEPLKRLGMKDMFDRSLANFSKMSKEPLMVSKVKQKAFIEVNEEGSEAAAVTSVNILSRMMPSPPTEFKVDRPSIFVITVKDVIIFMGLIKNPKY